MLVGGSDWAKFPPSDINGHDASCRRKESFVLLMRSLFAAVTINSIMWYCMSGCLAWYNVSIAVWCFAEWTSAFRDSDKEDVLDWVLPPLNQLCLAFRVVVQEFDKTSL